MLKNWGRTEACQGQLETEKVTQGREKKACMCLQAVGLPSHPSPPSVTSHITVRGEERHQCSSLSYSPTAISALQYCHSDSLQQTIQHLYFIFSIQTIYQQYNQAHHKIGSLYSLPLVFLQVHFFLSPFFPEHRFSLNFPSISLTAVHL